MNTIKPSTLMVFSMYHNISKEKVLKTFQTSRQGLKSEQVSALREKYGKNSIKTTSKKSILKKILKQFKDYMIILLIISALLSYYLGEFRSATILAIIVVFNASIGFLQEYKAERIMETLKKLINPYASIIRDGKQQEIKAENLLPGDIIILEEGKAVPADARVIESKGLATNDFALTGESNPVNKYTDLLPEETVIAEQSNMVFMGTTIAKGLGRAVVTSIGQDTVLGQIANLSETTKKDLSPLQKELNNISIKLTIGTIIVSAFLFVLALSIKLPLYDAFLFELGIGMALVPQGMPAQISIALSLASSKLAKKNVVVKQLSSVETLGSTSIICTDKTGTLTKNQMTVQKLWIGGQHYHVSGIGYKPTGKVTKEDGSPLGTERVQKNKLFFIGGICASTARIAEPDEYHSTRYTLGDPTEGAIITLGEKLGFDHHAVHQRNFEYTIFPFDSSRKRMSSIRQVGEQILSFVKGSPESILSETKKIFDGKEIREITNQDKKLLKEFDDQNAQNAMRNLAIAYKILKKSDLKDITQQEAESELILLGIVSMIDPPREEVQNAMKAAYDAHINVCIITGDYALTAKAIAHKVGLDRDGKEIKVIKGSMLSSMKDQEILESISSHHVIFSRTSPEDKLRIVTLVKHAGYIVAVTGDGINDAPALKKADVGVAMGLTGSDVAKEASSLILLKDSFYDLVYAIRQGRIIFANLKKTILSSLTSNGGELFVVLLSLLFTGLMGRPIAITPLMILAIDLVGEMLPLTALARDPGEESLMKQKPRNPDGHVIQGRGILDLIWAGFLMGAIPYLAFIIKLLLDGQTLSQDIASTNYYALGVSTTYVTLLMCQYANILSRRTKNRLLSSSYRKTNKQLRGSLAISIVLVCILLYIPAINDILGSGPIGVTDRGIAMIGGLIYLLIRELQKNTKTLKSL